jgi:hypothetical protein
LPNASITSANDTICAGDSVVLNASGGAAYTWTPGGQTISSVTVSPSLTQIYTVSVTDTNNCGNSAQFTLTVNPLPVVDFVLNPSVVCGNYPSVLLTGESPTGGTFTGSGVFNGYFTPDITAIGTGTFPITYTYTDANGCTDTAMQTMTLLECLGVEEETTGKTTVYPNPTADYITVQNDLDEIEKVEILDMTGRLIRVQTNAGKILSLNMGEYRQGSYIFRIHTAKGVETRTVIRVE